MRLERANIDKWRLRRFNLGFQVLVSETKEKVECFLGERKVIIEPKKDSDGKENGLRANGW